MILHHRFVTVYPGGISNTESPIGVVEIDVTSVVVLDIFRRAAFALGELHYTRRLRRIFQDCRVRARAFPTSEL
jgi:hypothetical protein